MLFSRQFYIGDCLEIMMNDIAPHSVDLIVCDLPYGVTQNKQDIRLPFNKLWECYNRVLKKTGTVVLFGQSLFFADLINSNRKMFKYDIVWDKVLLSNFLNAKRMPLRQHEQIAVFYNKGNTYNPQFTEGKPNHSKGTACFSKENTNNNYGKYKIVKSDMSGKKYPTSIIRVQKPHPSVAKHRTEKPVELMELLIKTYSNRGDVVLDNCMGSGSTGVASVLTDRGFIGIEIDENTYNSAVERVLGAISAHSD